MLKKIISGGQTGCDRAALDFAMKYEIPYCGWVPKGRLAEDGPIPERYKLQEMPTDSYEARTEQNVIDSDGTLIVARGKLTGGTDYTREMTLKHRKQLLGINLNLTGHYDAASLIASWIKLQHVEILNVAGPRAGEDPEIYRDVLTILEGTIQILRDEGNRKTVRKSRASESPEPPKTVGEAVDRLVAEVALKDKTTLANMEEAELPYLHFTLGINIRNRFLYPRNDKLLESCREIAEDKYLHWDQAAMVIIKELWKRLKVTHKLRLVK